jgi:hypothetical protein
VIVSPLWRDVVDVRCDVSLMRVVSSVVEASESFKMAEPTAYFESTEGMPPI